MLNFKRNTFYILTFSLFSAIGALGQAAMTPFSYLGIGEYYGNALAHNHGMAGVGVSNPQYFYLNNKNPALLVFNKFTNFSAGFIGEKRTVVGNGTSESNSNANLNYLIMGFPVKLGRWSSSLGLSPYSTVNYRLNYTDAIEGSTNTVQVTETGSGGINQFAWSNGVRMNDDISLGVKATYLFGSIVNEYSNTLTESDQPVLYNPTVYERTYVKDLNLTLGFSYHKDSLFRKNYKFNLGAVYDFRTDLRTELTTRIEQRDNIDTLYTTTIFENEVGSITLPQILTLGLSFGRGDKWIVGTDFALLDYRQYNDSKSDIREGTTGWRLSLGTEFTPNVSAMTSYLKRITYRTGINYEKYPYLINGMPVKDFGINFGFSLPVGRSSLDFALKMGKRGNLTDNTIEENYFKIYFGATFNDQWFIRRRFD